jgi:hypothetical protein
MGSVERPTEAFLCPRSSVDAGQKIVFWRCPDDQSLRRPMINSLWSENRRPGFRGSVQATADARQSSFGDADLLLVRRAVWNHSCGMTGPELGDWKGK